MKTLSLLDRKAGAVLGSSFLALALVGAISYRGIIASIDSNRWARHTHEVLERIQDLHLAWESIESDSHEFTLTGEDSSFESYRVDFVKADQYREAIGKLTLDNPRQQRQIPIVEALLSEENRRVSLINSLRRTRGLAAAAAVQGTPDERITVEFDAAMDKLQGRRTEITLTARRQDTREPASDGG
jgi:CHASE3 domain sensor protein